ncbi:late control protein D [Rhizobium sp. Root149]|uniref:phage late control D family protein n=1 Tax=Rhizobium sp. Root149 TaxID=1736473 RepID=UPI00071295D9|nr:contractile injection system protein, VgrG/Pvc8 family [Rhizobium sp. Root149]KQZ54629.1 late control protein D [Rhizobium sp. Root149]
MKPICIVTIDGQPVAGAFYERLISISVTDKDGEGADTVDIELNDGPPLFLSIPRKGAIIDVQLGYESGGLRSLGQFTADKVQPKCLPYSMSISGKSADLRSSKLKARSERHWEGKTLADVVGDLASESGLSPAIDSSIGSVVYPWLAQQDETPIHFLQRLAKRHNALFTVKAGRLIFAEKGGGQSASGAFVGSVLVTPSIILPGTCEFEANDRTRYSKVVAYVQDGDKAKRVEIEAEADADGESVYRLPEPFANLEEADKAAQAKAKDLKRGEGAASVTVLGDTAICAGAPLLFEGVRPGLDGVPYVIDTATHKFSKSGYTTQISAKLYDGKSGSGSGNGNGGDAADKGTVAQNSPPGTPATPSQWTNERRYGRTDEN